VAQAFPVSISSKVDPETGTRRLELLEDERTFDSQRFSARSRRQTPTVRSWKS
jgi:hypothetical protein